MRKRKGCPSAQWVKKFRLGAWLAGGPLDPPMDAATPREAVDVWGDAMVDGGPSHGRWLRWRAAMYWQDGLGGEDAGARTTGDLRDLAAGRPLSPPDLLAPPPGADDYSLYRAEMRRR
jgi:hypothetical protein